MSETKAASLTHYAGEADDCPHCGEDLAVHRVFYAGLFLLCAHCLTEVPPAPASAWGPAAPSRNGNWPSGLLSGTRPASGTTGRPPTPAAQPDSGLSRAPGATNGAGPEKNDARGGIRTRAAR
jgi:hypothetical protein